MNYLQSNNGLQIFLSKTVVGITITNMSVPKNIESYFSIECTDLISIIIVKILKNNFLTAASGSHNTI